MKEHDHHSDGDTSANMTGEDDEEKMDVGQGIEPGRGVAGGTDQE